MAYIVNFYATALVSNPECLNLMFMLCSLHTLMGESFSTAVFGLWGHWGFESRPFRAMSSSILSGERWGPYPQFRKTQNPKSSSVPYPHHYFPRGIRKAEMWLDVKRNLGTALLHLPLSLIGNAILSFFNVSGGEVGLMTTNLMLLRTFSSYSTVYKVNFLEFGWPYKSTLKFPRNRKNK